MVIWPGVVVLIVMFRPATKLVGPYLVPVESAAKIWPWTVGAVEVPVPPLAGVKALVKVRPAKVGVEVVVTDWFKEALPNRYKVLLLPTAVKLEIVEVEIVEEVMALVPVKMVLPPWRVKVLPLPFKVVLELTVKVLEPKVNVPLPAVRVLPLKLLALKAVAVVVAKVEVPVTNMGPETVKPVVEAFCREVLPETVRRLEMVVEPVTARVLEEELKVKLEEVAMVLLPWPNRMSLAVRFCSWMVGVKPPEEVTEPEPLTAVT